MKQSKDVRELISGLKSAVTALESAMGQNEYTDGMAFGNPAQGYDDKVDMGGEDGNGGMEGKKKAFVAMMRKKMGG